jgi:V8-like Glu-specific endopeptidase
MYGYPNDNHSQSTNQLKNYKQCGYGGKYLQSFKEGHIIHSINILIGQSGSPLLVYK